MRSCPTCNVELVPIKVVDRAQGPVQVGADWVGVFDGDLCVGLKQITELPMANPIVVYLEFIPPGSPRLW